MRNASPEAHIAYLMSRFPHLPETFILREMSELERQGWQIALYPLIRQKPAVVHAEAQAWMGRIRPLPFFSSQVFAAGARSVWRQPGRTLYLTAQAGLGNLRSPRFFARAMALLPKAVYAARQMQAEGISHIHAHYATHPALVAWLVHGLTGIPYSVTVHAHDIFVDRTFLAPKLRQAAFIVAISEYNRDFLVQHVGNFLSGKIHVVHCGIVPALYRPGPGIEGLSQRFEILSIGSLQPYKGQAYLIKACARLRQADVPFRCRIIGEGEERPHLEALIRDLQLEEQVELLGAQPQEVVAGFLQSTHCYVQPSVIMPPGKMEGIPVALMEALASRLPVIASAISGIPELVQPGKTGVLAPPADEQALAEALLAIYQRPAEALELAQQGRELVWREFNLHTNVQRLGSLFQAAGAGRSVLAVEATVPAQPGRTV